MLVTHHGYDVTLAVTWQTLTLGTDRYTATICTAFSEGVPVSVRRHCESGNCDGPSRPILPESGCTLWKGAAVCQRAPRVLAHPMTAKPLIASLFKQPPLRVKSLPTCERGFGRGKKRAEPLSPKRVTLQDVFTVFCVSKRGFPEDES